MTLLATSDHATAGADLVFAYFNMSWHASRRRGGSFAQDRIVETLLRGAEGVDRVLVAEAFGSAPARALRRLTGERPTPFPSSPRVALHQPRRLRRRDPVELGALRRAYEGYDRRLRRAAHDLGLERPAILTTSPFIAGLSPLEWAGPVTFYATDDWTGHHALQQYWPAFEAAFEGVRRLRRRVVGVSAPVVERIMPLGPATVVPNGIDPQEWVEPAPVPSWLAALPGPRLLYVGTLDSRLDVGALRSTAARFPGGTVVLLGRDTDPTHLAPLRELPNVHVEGWRPRSEVAAAVAAADVCLVPHVRTALTRSMSPLKLYEYLAAGRPVAAVDLQPIVDVGAAQVELVAAGDDFAEGVKRALVRGPMAERDRHLFLSENSWARRHADVVAFAVARGTE